MTQSNRIRCAGILATMLLALMITPSATFGQNLLNLPESVVYDSLRNCHFVSNYGGREIVRIDSDGNQSVFFSDVPHARGVLLHHEVLYVVSDTGLTGLDPVTAEVVWYVNTPPWVFPNDVVADSSGYLYVTDYIQNTDGGAVYQINIADSSYTLFADDMTYPNGIAYDHINNRLLTCGGHPTGRLTAISLPDGAITVPVYTPTGGLDGIQIDKAGNVYVSNWVENGVNMYGPELDNPPVFISNGQPGPADIFLDRNAHMLAVPCYYDNRVDFVPVAADQFRSVTGADIVHNGGCSQGASWADYDNDNFPDLFVSNLIYPIGEDNFLYHNEGDGSFSRILAGDIVGDMGYSRTSTWGDYDNDGDLDAYVANWPAQVNYLYENEGGTFTRITTGEAATEAKGSPGASWVDYDLDGDLDLFVANYGANSLFRNDDGTLVKVTSGDLTADVSDSYGAVWADIDNDGDPDVFVPTPAEGKPIKDNFLYMNNGDGTFSAVTADPVVSDGGSSLGGSWGDYDNDGDMDLFVTNAASEVNFLYTNNGSGSFTRVTSGAIVTDVASSFGSAWGDYDNDGDLDLFVGNAEFGSGSSDDYLYRNEGDGSFTRILTGDIVTQQGYGYGVAWADYDRDGDLDLYEARLEDQDNALFTNTGNRNNWISVKLEGTMSNRSAIGAKVRLLATINDTETWQLREISSQTGYCGQSSIEAHFGLGDADLIDSIKIEWPSGAVQILAAVSPNQFLAVTEQCCGAFTGGYTGNANCDTEGKTNLADISRLIDRVYLSKQRLCCEDNGNVNGDVENKINLADISRLIDKVYLSKSPTAPCP